MSGHSKWRDIKHKRDRRPGDMDEPVKIDEPFDEAVRKLLTSRDQATSDDESDSEDDSR